MTEKQYSQLLKNRRLTSAAPLSASGGDAKLLHTAAQNLRKRAAARKLLDELVPREWLDALNVTGLSGGVLTLRVTDPAVHGLLRRRLPGLETALAARLPGLHRVVVGPLHAPSGEQT